MKNGRIDKYLFGGGYAQASVASSTTDNFAFYYYNSTGSVLLITFPSKKLSMTYHGVGSLLSKAAERSACDHFLG